MNVKTIFKLVVYWHVILPVLAHGFSGLGDSTIEFTNPKPGRAFIFPQDHGAHPEYRIEWWYLTANLEDSMGNPFGLQWTLFRTATDPDNSEGWHSPQIWFAHAAITSSDSHLSTERFARGGIGQAGIEVSPFNAWIDEWSLSGPSLEQLSLIASSSEFRFEMSLTAEGPLVFHGENGFSVKSESQQASYYYSQPFYDIKGKLIFLEDPIYVTGHAWFDHEWSSQPLAKKQLGWDWFSLSFEKGSKLMGFQLRQRDGKVYSAATWIGADGNTQTYGDGAFTAEPLELSQVAGRDIPTRWQIKLPEKRIDVVVSALNPNSWMDLTIPYWEGPVHISGSHVGSGYLEMTGYD